MLQVLLWALVIVLAGCAQSPVARPSRAATLQPRATAATGSRASLDDCPPSRPLAGLRVLARVAGDPDDAAVTASGDVWVSDRDGGRLLELAGSGRMLREVADPLGPEGIVVLSDSRLLVAQQVPDRIDIFDPATNAFAPWLQLGSAAPDQGLDGIGQDGANLLVPDSAHGTLLQVALAANDRAGMPALVARGLGRPVAAAALDDGGIVVAVENQPGLLRIAPDTGRATALAHNASLDDVVVRRGLVYATDLGGGALRAVDPASGASRLLVSAAPAPQGLALLPDGALLLVDSTRRVLAVVPSCG